MTQPRLDVLAIGNAIVDVIADTDESFLAVEGMVKGTMRLIDEEEATGLYERMGPGRETSGGSAANTVAGLAALGLRTGFIGQVAGDQLGEIFRHDICSLGVRFETAPLNGTSATARCLILVTPDAQRTMNTFLGASQHLSSEAVEPSQIAAAAILYLEGYLWDSPSAREAMEQAIAAARQAGRKVAFTLSDIFVVERHAADIRRLLNQRLIDILFANEAELLALAGTEDRNGAIDALAPLVPVLVVTRSEHGAIAVAGGERAEVAAEPIRELVDTTGAGDLFAAGFLAGQLHGASLEHSLRLGAIAAAEVIQHYGARPEADLRALTKDLLG